MKRPTLEALQRAAYNSAAAFYRIPEECELDWVECRRRIKRMVETKARYYSALEDPNYPRRKKL